MHLSISYDNIELDYVKNNLYLISYLVVLISASESDAIDKASHESGIRKVSRRLKILFLCAFLRRADIELRKGLSSLFF